MAPPDPSAGRAHYARWRIRARGVVQGVGFRPFVYRRAVSLGLAGWVQNDPAGVAIEAEGEIAALEALVTTIEIAPPPGAVLGALACEPIPPCGEAGFAIRPSTAAGRRDLRVTSDLATCAACLTELFDPANRRYRHPFISCTQCGPRYSVIADLPYDRARTTMRGFPLCPACRAEYENPADRRFHAEPIACHDCGPRLALWDTAGAVLGRGDEALLAAAAAVRAGRIVAVKGLGGFHLIADARDERAVRQLRLRKNRPAKPLAVMFPALAALQRACAVSPAAAALLTSPACPIVLLKRRAGAAIAAAVAPQLPWLGALLPYTPLHHLLLAELGFPVVATSGNRGGEPIVTDAAEALVRLRGVTDLLLVHDRPILRPLDDSVLRLAAGEPLMLRRARGFSPGWFALDGLPPGIAACGGHLKATVALSGAGGVTLSQHLGDLDTLDARDLHQRALSDLARLHGITPRLAACDAHPDYASRATATALGMRPVAVPHHLAHVLAVMAEHGIEPPVFGLAWDGAGLGADGTIWGGEALRVRATGWERVARLRPFRLPGGEAAMREPRRAALGLLFAAWGEAALTRVDLAPIAAFSPIEREVLGRALAQRLNAPVTTSIGRLFDAFAALAGFSQRARHEGEAAMRLEAAAEGMPRGAGYPFALLELATEAVLELDWRPALAAALADLAAGRGGEVVAAGLHDGLATAIGALARRLGATRMVLSGGCFQNVRLLEAAIAALRAAGCEPLWPRLVPPNDGALALGQIVFAASLERQGEHACA